MLLIVKYVKEKVFNDLMTLLKNLQKKYHKNWNDFCLKNPQNIPESSEIKELSNSMLFRKCIFKKKTKTEKFIALPSFF